MRPSNSLLLGALGIGAVAAMRSMLAPALVSRALPSGGAAPARQPARALASRTARRVLPLLAGGEMVADKLPATPDRTEPPSLAGRVLSGALAGAALAAARRRKTLPAALVGGAAAFGASHAMIRLRKAATRRLGVPDVVPALVEDALAVVLGRAAARAAVPV